MGFRTQFQWMTDYSSATEEEIIDAAGHRACTCCYPTAPLDPNRPTKMFSTDEIAAAKAREDREAVRAAKAEKAAAVAVYDPDGGELTIPSYYSKYRDVIKTERAASNKAIEAARSLRQYGDRSASADAHRETLDLCVAALAHKRGVSKEAVLAEIEKKAAKPVPP